MTGDGCFVKVNRGVSTQFAPQVADFAWQTIRAIGYDSKTNASLTICH